MSDTSILPGDFTESTFKRKLVKTSTGMRRRELIAALSGFAVFAVVVLALGASRNQAATPDSIQALVSNREMGSCVRAELRAVQTLPYKQDEPITVGEVDAARKTCERKLRLTGVLDAQDQALSWRPTPK